jgi:cytoskeleton protein RodZ
MASELHLTVPIVEALEADDYERVESRVFVRGYLRNYARIVGLPTDSILRQFDEKWPDEGAHKAVLRPAPRLPADGGPARGLLSVITWLIVIGLLVLFMMWWRGYLGGKDAAVAPGAEAMPGPGGVPAAETAPSVDGLLLPGAMDGDGGLRLPPPPARDDLSLAVPGTAGPDSIEAAASTAVASSPPAPGASSPAVGAVGGAPTTDASPVASAGTGPAPPEPATTGQVVMTFTGPCWVDVRDSERQFKLFGEMPKGTQRVLGGTPPYNMVIGNARAVTITVDGVPYDLRPHAKGNVARFTLDP